VSSLVMSLSLLVLLLVLATGPVGLEGRGCVGVVILDPDIKASFTRFEAAQSVHAARACAAFHNHGSPAS
jgi:hypothetical protein